MRTITYKILFHTRLDHSHAKAEKKSRPFPHFPTQTWPIFIYHVPTKTSENTEPPLFLWWTREHFRRFHLVSSMDRMPGEARRMWVAKTTNEANEDPCESPSPWNFRMIILSFCRHSVVDGYNRSIWQYMAVGFKKHTPLWWHIRVALWIF